MDFIFNTIEAIIKAPFILVGWVIIGLVAGEMSRRLMGSADQGGCSDLVLGMLGAWVGGFVARLIGIGTPDGGLPLFLVNMVIATVGAMILIVIGRLLRGGPQQSRN